NAQNNIHINTSNNNHIAKTKKDIHLKKKLNNHPNHANIDLTIQIINITLRTQHIKINFEINNKQNLKIMTLTQPLNQFNRALIPI
ncbi:hypothetical protein DF186_19360, partial [Enterococcus hirae]